MSDDLDFGLDPLLPRAQPVEEPDKTTWRELAQEEGRKLGVLLSDDAADFILWERTAFPFIGPDELRRAIAAEVEENWKNYKPKETGPTVWDKLKSDE